MLFPIIIINHVYTKCIKPKEKLSGNLFGRFPENNVSGRKAGNTRFLPLTSYI